MGSGHPFPKIWEAQHAEHRPRCRVSLPSCIEGVMHRCSYFICKRRTANNSFQRSRWWLWWCRRSKKLQRNLPARMRRLHGPAGGNRRPGTDLPRGHGSRDDNFVRVSYATLSLNMFDIDFIFVSQFSFVSESQTVLFTACSYKRLHSFIRCWLVVTSHCSTLGLPHALITLKLFSV